MSGDESAEIMKRERLDGHALAQEKGPGPWKPSLPGGAI
jgi:hypothetical protein